jgi:TM2 domain-containing membrane protein YozV
MTVRLRVSGDPEEIEIMLKVLAVVFDFTGSHRIYRNHGAPGVRVYLTARIPWVGDKAQPRRGDGPR